MPDRHIRPGSEVPRGPRPAPSPPSEPSPGGSAADSATARPLCDVRALAGLDPAPAGALWKLAEPGRQLDANLVHLPAGERVEAHAEPDLDVLLLVVAGGGALETPEGTERLADGALFWLPRGSTRAVAAGPDGLSYLTVHRRRPGMQIRPRPS